MVSSPCRVKRVNRISRPHASRRSAARRERRGERGFWQRTGRPHRTSVAIGRPRAPAADPRRRRRPPLSRPRPRVAVERRARQRAGERPADRRRGLRQDPRRRRPSADLQPPAPCGPESSRQQRSPPPPAVGTLRHALDRGHLRPRRAPLRRRGGPRRRRSPRRPLVPDPLQSGGAAVRLPAPRRARRRRLLGGARPPLGRGTRGFAVARRRLPLLGSRRRLPAPLRRRHGVPPRRRRGAALARGPARRAAAWTFLLLVAGYGRGSAT